MNTHTQPERDPEEHRLLAHQTGKPFRVLPNGTREYPYAPGGMGRPGRPSPRFVSRLQLAEAARELGLPARSLERVLPCAGARVVEDVAPITDADMSCDFEGMGVL